MAAAALAAIRDRLAAVDLLEDDHFGARPAATRWLAAAYLPVLFLTGFIVHRAPVTVTVLGAMVMGRWLEGRSLRNERRRSAELAGDLARVQSGIESRESVAELSVNLARRNQDLLDRQLAHIVAMEERTADPEVLGDLFTLEHLGTRVRRNAESLLVICGEETPRTWIRPVLLADVVRAAVAEVEDFARCDTSVDPTVAVSGEAVADLSHLLAELVENGLSASPGHRRVQVRAKVAAEVGCVVVVEDMGTGMPTAERQAINELLSKPPDVDLRLSKRLGLHVVSRLAARHGIAVRVTETPGGGTTVAVTLPAEVLAATGGALPEPATPEPIPGVEQSTAASSAEPAPAGDPPTVAGRALATGEPHAADELVSRLGGATLAGRRIEPPPARYPSRPVAAPDPSGSRSEVRAMLSRFQSGQVPH